VKSLSITNIQLHKNTRITPAIVWNYRPNPSRLLNQEVVQDGCEMASTWRGGRCFALHRPQRLQHQGVGEAFQRTLGTL